MNVPALQALARDGMKYQKRTVTLTEEHLGFSKIVSPGQDNIKDIVNKSGSLPIAVLELQQAFNKHDKDENGVLDVDEATACLVELHLYRSATSPTDRLVSVFTDFSPPTRTATFATGNIKQMFLLFQ